MLADVLESLAGRPPRMTRVKKPKGLPTPCGSRDRLYSSQVAKRETADAPLASAIIERDAPCRETEHGVFGFRPHQLCRLMAVSRSKLYRMFEASGGVAAFIQRERLQAALVTLSDARETRSINVVANDVGFPDHSTFSRAFPPRLWLQPERSARHGPLRPRRHERSDRIRQPSRGITDPFGPMNVRLRRSEAPGHAASNTVAGAPDPVIDPLASPSLRRAVL